MDREERSGNEGICWFCLYLVFLILSCSFLFENYEIAQNDEPDSSGFAAATIESTAI